MKNRRWFRLAGWLLTLVMLLTVIPAATIAEDGGGNTEDSNALKPAGGIIQNTEVDITGSVKFAYTDAKGKAVAVEAMDPNSENWMKLTVSGLNGNKDIVKGNVMTVTLPENIVITESGLKKFSNDSVNASVNDGKLRFSWKDATQDTLEATFAILPHIKTENDISGSYVLGTESKVMLSIGSFVEQSRHRLNASEFTEQNGIIYPNTDVDPVWILTHVSGDYYTIRSKNTGEYLYISPSADSTKGYLAKSLYLVNANQETAQKILVKNQGNGYYSFHYGGGAITNVGEHAYNGFATFVNANAGSAYNEKFKLYPASALAHEPIRNLSGSWTVYNEQNKNVLTVKDNTIASVRYKFKNGTEMYPNSDAVKWTFEHINRNWYTIKTGDKYLNVSDKGVSVSSTAQHLMIKSNDDFNSIVITNGEFDTVKIAYALNSKDYTSFNTVKTAVTNNTRFKLTDSVSGEQFDVSGEWAVITPSSGAVLLAKASGSNKLASGTFETMEDGTIYSDAEAGISWTFTKEDGNWYSVRTQDGKYLSIKDANVTLSNEKTLVYIQKDNNLYRITNGAQFGMNNSGNDAKNGYNGVNNAELNASEEWHELKKPTTMTSRLYLDVNGGTGDTAPDVIAAEAGTQVVLPSLSAKKDGQEFIGWADVKDFYSKVPGTNHTYHDLYKAGTSYTMNSGKNTLYAVYFPTTKKVQFGIRKDGIIQDEPNGYPVDAYCGHFTVEGILKEGHWVIDIDSTKPVNDYYVQNNVTAALNWVPSAEQIAAALKKEGNIDFDPETQYIHYYVLKDTSATVWKVDGVIRNKANVEITYDANVPGTEKAQITNMPGAYQVSPGTDIKIGADQGSTETKRPGRKGYYFRGWNTEKDGSGTYYNENTIVHMTQNLYLYAVWVSEEEELLEIRITSDWPVGKVGRVGDRITLTAELTGFENKEYTLRWQYSTDLENWTYVPNAHDITYTYTLDELTTHYTWRAVAEDIR